MTTGTTSMTPEQYIAANPEHSVTMAMNVQASATDRRLRITFERRRGPYKPVTLGVYVEETFEDALVKHLSAEAEKDKAEAMKQAKRTEEKA